MLKTIILKKKILKLLFLKYKNFKHFNDVNHSKLRNYKGINYFYSFKQK